MAKSSNSGANGLSGMFPFGMPGSQGGSTPQVMPNVGIRQLGQPASSGPIPAISKPQPNPAPPDARFAGWPQHPNLWGQQGNSGQQNQNGQGLFAQNSPAWSQPSLPSGGWQGLFGSLGVPQVGSPGMPAMPNLPNLPYLVNVKKGAEVSPGALLCVDVG